MSNHHIWISISIGYIHEISDLHILQYPDILPQVQWKEFLCFGVSKWKWLFRIKWYFKLNVTTENRYLTAAGVHACTYTFTHTHTHTHSWLYITLGITQLTLCPVSNIPEETMFQILLAGMKMERHLLSCVRLRKPITITVHPTLDTSAYICTYDHNSCWFHFGYLPRTELDQMCTETGSFKI